ncbi:MAG: Mut7-C RNAse domain-containing protein [Pyrobaculum sp.]
MVDCVIKGVVDLSCVYVDSMLGWLARMLRILFGIKTLYAPDADDADLKKTACVVVTRDEQLFKARRGPTILLKTEDHVKWVAAFISMGAKPLEKSACPICGGELREVDCAAVEAEVGHKIRSTKCWKCTSCGKVYWRGSHWRRLEALLQQARATSVQCLHTG